MIRSFSKTLIQILGPSCSRRFASDCPDVGKRKGLVLGAYDGCNPGELKLTPTANKFDEEMGGKLRELLKGTTEVKKGKVQVFTNICEEFLGVAVAGLGPEEAGYNEMEGLDECRENIRVAAGAGARALQDRNLPAISVESFTNSEAAAEGASLAVWVYDELKKRDDQSSPVKLDLYQDPDREGWQRGTVKADAQNLARRLEETPANLLTPTTYAQRALDVLCPCGVTVDIRDRDWIESKRMAAFLSIAKSSCEPPLFLELSYCGGDVKEKPVILIGKGVTFDSGGIYLKKAAGMAENRADMAGAAVMTAVMRAASIFNLPINLQAVIPLCESMLGGMSVKPGDVVLGLNGKTIRIEDTDNEGRVILTDAISYASKAYDGCLILNAATMSIASRKAFGRAASACFATSDMIWEELKRAGSETGDRFWRLPLWRHFSTKVTDYVGVDVNNVGRGPGAGACLGAAFLLEFVPPKLDFVHLDLTGTGMKASKEFPYLRENLMSGRPVRTIVQFLYQMACPHEKGDDCGP